MDPISVVEADLELEEYQQAVLELIHMYASDPMGIDGGLPAGLGPELVAGLRAFPTSVLYLAYTDEQPIGLAVCFLGFSTFAAKPLLNVHDLIVHPEFRRLGIASQILAHAERDARQRGCCRVTLEVRCDNERARSLYRQRGFGPGDPPYEFWSKSLAAPECGKHVE